MPRKDFLKPEEINMFMLRAILRQLEKTSDVDYAMILSDQYLENKPVGELNLKPEYAERYFKGQKA